MQIHHNGRRPGINSKPITTSLNPLAELDDIANEPRVLVRPDFVRRCAGTNSARDGIMLSQILYWSLLGKDGLQRGRARKKLRAEDESEHFVPAYAPAEWAAQTGLSPNQAKQALRALRDQRLIETGGRGKTAIRLSDTLREQLGDDAPVWKQGVMTYARVVRGTSTPIQALVLSQACWWHDLDRTSKPPQCRLRVHRDGRWRWASRYQEIAAQTGISSRQARHAVERLAAQGVIESAVFRFAGSPTVHIAINPEAVRILAGLSENLTG